METSKVKTFEEPMLLERAITAGNPAPILITAGNGYPQYLKVAVSLCRKFWGTISPMSLGVIGDSDCGPVYEQTLEKLEEILRNPNRVPHNFKPSLEKNPNSHAAKLTCGHEIDVHFWTHEITRSLDDQILTELKAAYPTLRNSIPPAGSIEGAAFTLGRSLEELVQESAQLANTRDEQWFRCLKSRLQENLI